jgi:hypothetical protein
MKITSGVEDASVVNDFFFQLLVICVANRLDEESGRGAAIANNDTLLDEVSACFSYVFFDRSGESDYTLVDELEVK